MIKTLFRKKIDRSTNSDLPSKAQRIVHGVAREFLMSARSAKNHEIAYANLHMRLYQQFGRASSDMVPKASEIFLEIVGPKPAI